MVPVFALGAAGGLIVGIATHLWFPGGQQQPAGDAGSSESSAPAEASTSSNAAGYASSRSRRPRLSMPDGLAAGGIAALTCMCAAAATAAAFIIGRQRRSSKGPGGRHRRKDGCIPLPDLIRFKERQWFVEELENARDADPNAMLRLAKMYLHGQGCQRNIALAQEWVRKARSLGVPASLDELFATDDPDPRGRLRALAAQEERRRALRRSHPGAADTAQQTHPSRQQHNTAAA